MAADALPTSLQESILAALIFDEKAGAVVASQVEAKYFDEGYRDIAQRVLAYRRKYQRAPGRAHLDDLFGKIIQEGRTPRMRRLVFGLADLADGLNVDYVVARTQTFIREQNLKSALVDANSRFEQGGEELAPEVEAILSRALRARSKTFDAGTFLKDTKRALRFLERDTSDGISLGIPHLEKIGLRLYPEEMTLYIGPKGTGKTWGCINVGKQGVIQRKKVLHITLEFGEDLTVGRYMQAFFAMAMKGDKYDKTYLEFDKLRRLTGFHTRTIAPRWDLSKPSARRELRHRLQSWGSRFGRLVVKEFPSGDLTIDHLESYLDYLELEHHFVPHLLIIDYPQLMKQDKRDVRTSIGQTFVDLRGLLKRRHMAGYFPAQGNRDSIKAKRVTSKNAAEDISMVFTADNVLVGSRTEEEAELGLGRLLVEFQRNGRSGDWIVLTQDYNTGQYVIDSALMQHEAYWSKLKSEADYE